MRTLLSLVRVVVLSWLLLGKAAMPTSRANEPTKDDAKKDSVDEDYSSELPRIPGKSPQEAMATFKVAAGFRIEQIAAEPLVTDPVAAAFDENGRLYVVEMLDYSEDDKSNLGRVRLLEDIDGDGKYEKSTIFVTGLSWPTAIECWQGGIFVGAAPHLFYFKDTNGDRQADERRLIYTGFSRSNVQGMLNSFRWGLDGRIHGSASSGGGDVLLVNQPLDEKLQPLAAPSAKTNTDPAVNAQAVKPIALRGRDFAFDPRTFKLEPISGGAQHGASFDDWGTRFVCHNSDHIMQVMYEDRYVARNPYLAPPASRLSIGVEGPQADVFRTSPVEPWRIVRTRLRKKGVIPGVVEGGGRPAGYFTSATGVTIYRGDAWSKEFLGWAFVSDVGSNLIHRKRLDPNGIPFTARRVDEKMEFITSDDVWFRPVQFANAPDGTLHVLDMYRETIEHPASIHPVIKKHLDLTSGRDRGRIYRIVPDQFKPRPFHPLGKMTTAELCQTLSHTNGWHRDTASRVLIERQDRAALPALNALLKSKPTPDVPVARLHALYVLANLNGLTAEHVLIGMADSEPRVRQHAVRLAEQVAADSPEVRERLFALVGDSNLHVRYQLAFTLGELSGPQREPALAALARRDAADPWLRAAVRSSLAEGSGAVFSVLAKDREFRQTAAGRDWLKQLAEQIGKQQRSDDVAAVLVALANIDAAETATFQTILQGLAAKAGSELEKQLAAATGGRAETAMKELVAAARKVAANPEAKTPERVAAIQSLRLGKFGELSALFETLLEPAQPADVQGTALATLATFTDPAVAPLVLKQWLGLSPRLRSQAADVLFSRTEWVAPLLTNVIDGTISSGDVDPARWKLLAEHRDAAIREQAMALVKKLQIGRRGDVVATYQDVLQMEGDATRGREVFKKVCAACHQVQGVGHPTGPNLAAMKSRGSEAILLNVLDPNREVNPQYLNYTVVTTDGRTLSGMIVGESATSVILKRADNATDTVLRIDIDQLRSSGLSLMPEGMEKQLDKAALADVIAYLKSVD